MAYSEQLAERVRILLNGRDGITERKMFGGLAIMLRGNMCCGVTGDDLMLRVGPERYRDALTRPGVRPMDLTGRPMKGMVFVEARAIDTDEKLRDWLATAAAFAEALPAKAKKRRATKVKPPARREQ